jgi:hypothetical protein
MVTMMEDSKLVTLKAEQAAFNAHLPEMLRGHRGEFAVFHGGQLVGYFPTHEAAYEAALAAFGLDEVFLISEVTEQPPHAVSVSWNAGMLFG